MASNRGNYFAEPDVLCEDGEIRLVGAASPNEGRVEICYNSQWGTVCHLGWGGNEAQVVCRELGYQTEGNEEGDGGDVGDVGVIYLSEVSCDGTEDTLGSCSGDPIGENLCSHFQDAGVICTGEYIWPCQQGGVWKMLLLLLLLLLFRSQQYLH